MLAGTVGWRAVFLVTVPVSLAAVGPGPASAGGGRAGCPAHRRLGRRRRRHRGGDHPRARCCRCCRPRLDLARGSSDCSPSPSVLMAVFIAIERRAADPLVPVSSSGRACCAPDVAVALLGGGVPRLDLRPCRALLPAGPRDVPAAGRLRHGPHVPDGVRRLVGRAAASVGRHRPRAQPRPRPRRPRDRSPLAGIRASEPSLRVAVLPGLLLVATGVALSFTPTTMVVASAVPGSHTGWRPAWPAAAMQVGGAIGTAAFIVVGVSVAGSTDAALDPAGFSAAFTAAALVALLTAALGSTLAPRGARTKSHFPQVRGLVEPPVGIEPTTYSLRVNRSTD